MDARHWMAIGAALASGFVYACSGSKSVHEDEAQSGTGGTTMTGSSAPMNGSGGAAAHTPVSSGGAGGTTAHPPATSGTGGKAGGGNMDQDGGVSDGGAGDAAAPSSGDTGTLPPIDDPSMPGHFTPTTEENVGPNGNYTTIAPKELGEEGIKHPILIWGPGAGSWPAIYQTLLDHVASHGFVVVSYNSTPQGPELNTAIDWIVDESKRDGSTYFDKVDTTKIAMGGQSAGSLATFVAAKDERLTTTVHINGGTFDPHTDVMNLIRPAFFLCGDDPSVTGGDGTYESDLARPNCDIDFINASVPVWYGVVIGSSHTTVIDNPLNDPMSADPLIKLYLASTAAWLRWQLAGDQTMKELFVGPSCSYCTQTSAWLVQQKDLQ